MTQQDGFFNELRNSWLAGNPALPGDAASLGPSFAESVRRKFTGDTPQDYDQFIDAARATSEYSAYLILGLACHYSNSAQDKQELGRSWAQIRELDTPTERISLEETLKRRRSTCSDPALVFERSRMLADTLVELFWDLRRELNKLNRNLEPLITFAADPKPTNTELLVRFSRVVFSSQDSRLVEVEVAPSATARLVELEDDASEECYFGWNVDDDTNWQWRRLVQDGHIVKLEDKDLISYAHYPEFFDTLASQIVQVYEGTGKSDKEFIKRVPGDCSKFEEATLRFQHDYLPRRKLISGFSSANHQLTLSYSVPIRLSANSRNRAYAVYIIADMFTAGEICLPLQLAKSLQHSIDDLRLIATRQLACEAQGRMEKELSHVKAQAEKLRRAESELQEIIRLTSVLNAKSKALQSAVSPGLYLANASKVPLVEEFFARFNERLAYVKNNAPDWEGIARGRHDFDDNEGIGFGEYITCLLHLLHDSKLSLRGKPWQIGLTELISEIGDLDDRKSRSFWLHTGLTTSEFIAGMNGLPENEQSSICQQAFKNIKDIYHNPHKHTNNNKLTVAMLAASLDPRKVSLKCAWDTAIIFPPFVYPAGLLNSLSVLTTSLSGANTVFEIDADMSGIFIRLQNPEWPQQVEWHDTPWAGEFTMEASIRPILSQLSERGYLQYEQANGSRGVVWLRLLEEGFRGDFRKLADNQLKSKPNKVDLRAGEHMHAIIYRGDKEIGIYGQCAEVGVELVLDFSTAGIVRYRNA